MFIVIFFDKYYNIEYTRTWKKPLKNRSFFFLAYLPCSYHFAICLWYIAISASCRTWEKFTWLVSANVFSTLIFVSFTSFHPNLLCCRMDISPIPPLYTDFDGDIENIFVRLILTSSRSIHRSEKRESAIFSHSRMDFTPKDRKTGSQKVKRDFVKKMRHCIIFPEKKQVRKIIQNARWCGGDNLSIKRLYFESTLRLAFFRAQL